MFYFQYFEEQFDLSEGDSALFINGLMADLDVYDVFTLLDTLKSEAKLLERLHGLGLGVSCLLRDISKYNFKRRCFAVQYR